MTRSAWEWWSALILLVVFVVVGVSAGWGWAFLVFGVGLFVSLVVSESRRLARRPASPPKRQSPPPCGGIAEGCPICLAASVALGVMVGDWLSAD